MRQPNYSFYFLLICLAAAISLVYLIAQPFLTPLTLAAVFAFLFQPVYRRFLHTMRGHRSLAALMTIMVIIILIVVPILYLGTQIFRESTLLYQAVTTNSTSIGAVIKTAMEKLYATLPALRNVNIDITQYIERALDSVMQNTGTLFSNATKLLLDIFMFLMACYFLLKDGRKLTHYLVKISPLQDEDTYLIIARLEATVLSVMKGTLFVGLIQGVICGVGFMALGIPNALLWGSVAVVAALVPGIGTALVTVPAIMFSFFMGSTATTLALLVLALAVGLIDNVIRPKLVSNDIQIHPLAVFIMVIGGLALFGPTGFILGPLAIVIFTTLIDIYFSVKTREAQENVDIIK